MQNEVNVALNFLIGYLYNKLPRRRVNIFGEELEKALKEKFAGHWYPDKPFKGSAYRCLKTGDPVDPVLDIAARESGVPLRDILENLPHDLAVWVDPGEVSYRIGEKGAVTILFSESGDIQQQQQQQQHQQLQLQLQQQQQQNEDSSADREVTKMFNPEAQCFRPIEAVGTCLSGLSLAPKSTSPFGAAPNGSPATTPFKSSTSPVPSFLQRSAAPLTFTTATFAQTKFGSTKLKTSSKRANRMSPTEFSNYIKQRALQQQQQQQQQQLQHHTAMPQQLSPSGRALSPHSADGYVFGQFPGQYQCWDNLAPFIPQPAHYQQPQQQPPVNNNGQQQQQQTTTPNTTPDKQLLEGLNNFGLAATYSNNQYQHLLVAN